MTPAQGRTRTPWVSPSFAAAGGRGAGPLLQMGFLGFCFYLFAYYSRILDTGLAGLHLPGIALGVAAGVAALSGGFGRVLQNRIGVFMAGLTIWLLISIPGGFWRGGSIDVLMGSWIPTLLLFFAGASVITTVERCRRSLFVLGLASVTGAMIVTLRGAAAQGRLFLAGSRYANANTIAIMLLLGMPMVWLMAFGPQAGKVRKAVVGCVLVMMVITLFRTGSREGLIGLAVLCATAFARSRAFGKIAVAVTVMVLALGSTLLLPQSVKSRLGTIFGPESVEIEGADDAAQWAVAHSAAESSRSRLRLLEDSLAVTASHPFLGVGPGNFAPYCAAKEKAKARPGFALWVGTHNTYTQVSSEMGIPGLLFYLGVLVASMGALQRIYRRAKRIPGNQGRGIGYTALALHTSFVALCAICFFNHMAYEPTMPLMAAIALAISTTAPDELSRLEEAARVSAAAKESNSPRANQGPARPGARFEKAR